MLKQTKLDPKRR